VSRGIPALTWPLLLVTGIGAFLLLRLRAGQVWDGDFALYVLNAQNIIHHLPYARTPYLFNPANPIDPTAYPPALPLLFTPLIYFLGVDLWALKLECLVALILFLAVYWALANENAGSLAALVATAAMGLNPFVVRSSSTIASEFPFLLFCYLSLLSFERLQSAKTRAHPTLAWYVVMAALATAFAYLTRSAGIVLFPAAFASSLWRERRLVTPTTVALAGAAALCVAIQTLYRGDVGTYLHYFDQFSPMGLLTNAGLYWHGAVALLGTSRLATSFCTVLLVIAAVGFVARLRTMSVLECFFVFYVGLLIVYPISLEVKRYEMPVWPLLFLYCVHGVRILTQKASPLARQAVATALVLIVSFLYVGQLRRLDYGPVAYSVTDLRSAQLFDALRQLPPQARLLTRHPTITALYTQRTSSTWPARFTDEELKDYLRRSGTRYIVQDIPHLQADPRDTELLDPFLDRNRPSLRRLFANEWFNVYQVPAQWMDSPGRQTASTGRN
jgi:4-amino-4-deoxy-L-arabinose transferase-like glycosyltransferase